MAKVDDSTIQQITNVNSDILGTLSGSVAHIDSTTSQIKTDTASLKQIYDLLASNLNQRRFSQSSANDRVYGSRNSDSGRSTFNSFRDRQRERQEQRGGTRDVTRDRRSNPNVPDTIIDPRDWERFVAGLQKSLNDFTDEFNKELERGLDLSRLSETISRSTHTFASGIDDIFSGASSDMRRGRTQFSRTVSSIFDDREYRETRTRVRSGLRNSRNAFEEFDDRITEELGNFRRGFADEFRNSLHFASFRDIVDGALSDFARSIGSDVEHMSEDFGRQMSQALLQETGIGNMISNFTDRLRQSYFNFNARAQQSYNNARESDPNSTASQARTRVAEAQAERMRQRAEAEAQRNQSQFNSEQDSAPNRVDRAAASAERAQEQATIETAIQNASISSDFSDLTAQVDHISGTLDAIADELGVERVQQEAQEQQAQEQAQQQAQEEDSLFNTTEEAQQNIDASDITDMIPSEGQTPGADMMSDAVGDAVSNATGDVVENAVGDAVGDAAGGMLENLSGGFADFAGNLMGNIGNLLEGAGGGGGIFGRLSQGLANVLDLSAGSGAATAAEAGVEAASTAAAGAEAAGAASTAAAGAEAAAAGTAAAGTAAGTAAAGAGTAAAGTAAAGTAAAGAGAGGALAGGALAGPWGLVAVGAVMAVSAAVEHFQQELEEATQQLRESWQEFREVLSKAANHYFEREKSNIDEMQKRLQRDLETMIKRPFEIMEAAAQEWYDAWDQNLQTITGTQGYTKSDLQDLMASYAERLRNEGLGDIVSAADMTEQLAKVLESGLSGTVAEEFAYLATKLNAAVPTQDFFGYAAEYASVAANAIQAGQDQASAIALANAELEQFASNVLYASRMISGGFSTGLQNASDLFAKANQIARSAGLLDSSQISAVLTSVASAVGAVAPQLAGGLVDAVVSAAIGENSETLTALRSLAHTGASTTAFLREFAADPQKIFVEIFKSLSNLQNMNADNYMEVAQSLSGIFGIDAAAFSQIDFGALATSVQSMKVNSSALDENMTLLSSGQTTTLDEQMKMEQINEMILNEGLSYVLDNQAARAIQQHMWDQELAQELMEATYGVELEGSTFKLLESIRETTHNIFNILNPFSWIEKAFNTAAVVTHTESLKADIKRMLELGKVGAGNAEAFQKLTTYSAEMLNNVDDLVTMMSGTSGVNLTGMSGTRSIFASVLGMFDDGLNAMQDASHALANPFSFSARQISALGASLRDAIVASSAGKSPSSQYNWAYVGKSVAQALQNTDVNAAAMAYTGPTALQDAESLQEAIEEDAAAQMEAFLETMEDAAKYQVEWQDDRTGRKIPTGNVTAMSYDEWKETAADFGIEDLEQALEDYGMTEEQLQGAYQDYQAAAVSEYNWQREMYEWAFWESGINFWENAFPDEYRDPLFERFDHLLELTTHIDEVLTYWEELWQYDWFYQSWSVDWLNIAWNMDWLKNAWHDDWLKEAWTDDWLTDRWDKYWEAWFEWYFEHEVYSEETGQAYQASDVVNASADYTGDAILALAAALTQNTIDLKDPTVQTNALLAQILIVTEAIMQAENTSGSAALATTLAGLSLGME